MFLFLFPFSLSMRWTPLQSYTPSVTDSEWCSTSTWQSLPWSTFLVSIHK